MDFRTAANTLGRQISTADIAEALGVSPHSVRQARLVEGGSGYRTPPKNWEKILLSLTEERIRELERLAKSLEEPISR